MLELYRYEFSPWDSYPSVSQLRLKVGSRGPKWVYILFAKTKGSRWLVHKQLLVPCPPSPNPPVNTSQEGEISHCIGVNLQSGISICIGMVITEKI